MQRTVKPQFQLRPFNTLFTQSISPNMKAGRIDPLENETIGPGFAARWRGFPSDKFDKEESDAVSQ